MADTITINGTTYHKLANFNRCSSSVSGPNATFPHSFIQLQENGNYFDVVEINSTKCIDEYDLTDTFLDSKNPKNNKTIEGTIFYHCVCVDDLKISQDTEKNPLVYLHMYVDDVLNYNYITAGLYETDAPLSSNTIKTVFTQNLFGNSGGTPESYTWDKRLSLPLKSGSGIRVVNQKNNTNAGYMRISFFINGYEGFRMEQSNKTSIASNSMNQITDYCRLWSICKLANKNNIIPKFEYTHVA